MASSNEDTDCLDDFTLVWLDASISRFTKRQVALYDYVNVVRSFDESEPCIEYLQSSDSNHIFLIVSGSLGEHVVPRVHALDQIVSIYVFCFDKDKHDSWTSPFDKVHGIFNDEMKLADKLCQDVRRLSSCLTSISIFNPMERTVHSLDAEQTTFMWFQLLVEILLRLKVISAAQDQMREECCSNYASNQIELEKINQFFHNYTPDNAVYWYTRDSFLYRLLNKAFRTQNIDIIFKYRFFLSDLYKQLSDLHKEQFKSTKSILTVYRGQNLRVEELSKIQKSVGQLISINSFFSTSRLSAAAYDFAGDGSERPYFESVIFEITLDTSITIYPFAEISELSCNKSESEILIAMGTVFRVENVDMWSDRLWCIKLVQSTEIDEQVTELMKFYKTEIGLTPTSAVLGLFLTKMGDFDKAERYYRKLLDQLPKRHGDRGVIMNNLGEVCRQLDRNDEAMNWCERAKIFINQTMGAHPGLAVVLSNMALICVMRNKSKEAHKHLEFALKINQKSPTPSQHHLTTIYNNTAKVHEAERNYSTALQYYEKALELEMIILPTEHPSIGMTCHNMGTVYLEMEDYDNALVFYKKALTIYQQSLPGTHPLIADVHISLGGVYCKRDEDYGLAHTHLEAAENIVERAHVDSDHFLCLKVKSNLGTLLMLTGMHDKAFKILSKLFDARRDSLLPRHSLLLAEVGIRLGILSGNKGDRTSALAYLRTAATRLYAFITPRNYLTHKFLYVTIIDALQRFQDHEHAAEHYENIIHLEFITSSSHDPTFLASIYNNAGVAQDRLNNTHRALEHYKAGLNQLEMIDSPYFKEIAVAHQNIAAIHLHNKEYNMAKLHFRHAIEELHRCSNSTIDYSIMALLQKRLGDAYFCAGQYENAKTEYNTAVQLLINKFGADDPRIPLYQQHLKKAEENFTNTDV